ncbi:MAG: hypothetical protein KDD66_11965 [Bdellovibrionales bacterium]|nr:hypothetical protein [Bdellovibrionales bacterium]
MNNEIQQDASSEDAEFPSVKLLVSLYSYGAIFALVLSFSAHLDSTQIGVCLMLCWLLTSGALGLSVCLKESEEEEDFWG